MEKLGEYFINFKENKFFKILNYLITFISIFFVITTLFEFDLSKIFLINTNNLIIYTLIVSCSFFIQSRAWGKLFNNKNSKFYSIIWINSNIGKYVPLKVGVVINRYAKLKDESVKSVTKNYFWNNF